MCVSVAFIRVELVFPLRRQPKCSSLTQQSNSKLHLLLGLTCTPFATYGHFYVAAKFWTNGNTPLTTLTHTHMQCNEQLAIFFEFSLWNFRSETIALDTTTHAQDSMWDFWTEIATFFFGGGSASIEQNKWHCQNIWRICENIVSTVVGFDNSPVTVILMNEVVWLIHNGNKTQLELNEMTFRRCRALVFVSLLERV